MQSVSQEEIIMNADEEEQKFLEACRKLLTEEGFHTIHPLNDDRLPRAQPCQGTHRLEYNPLTKEYTPVPIVPQHERGA